MTRLAAVDLRRGRYVSYASSLTVDGLWVANGHHELLDGAAGDEELGGAAARALAASRTGVPAPDLRNGPSPLAPVLASVGVRSLGSYLKGTRQVQVEQDGPGVVVTPTDNQGRTEGFVEAPDLAIRLTDPTPAELGAAVRDALARSS